ncbi:MAG: Rrf2 family transcriptional regulator [Vicingaceae bacterium]
MFSKACEYGIKASLFVAQRSESPGKVRLQEIAKAISSPEAFTAKILQQLVKANIIHSRKGPNGGFYIELNELPGIKLIDVVVAIDGDKIFHGCALGLEECSEKSPCPVHEQFGIIRSSLKTMLENTSFAALMSGLDSGLTFLK